MCSNPAAGASDRGCRNFIGNDVADDVAVVYDQLAKATDGAAESLCVIADQHLVGLQEHIIQRERSADNCLKYAAAFGRTVGLACHRVQEHPARRERYAAPVLNQQAAAAASRK